MAVVLRHVEENASAPLREWRRIHGALALLERLLRPGAVAGARSDAYGEDLVGRVWFEAKMEARLKELASFDYPEDKRVALLLRRAAAAAQAAAAENVLKDEDDLDSQEQSTAPDSHSEGGLSVPSDGPAGTDGPDSSAGSRHRASPQASAPVLPPSSSESSGLLPGSSLRGEAIGKSLSDGGSRQSLSGPRLSTAGPGSPMGKSLSERREDDLKAACTVTNNKLRDTASALDALRDTGTRWRDPKEYETGNGKDAGTNAGGFVPRSRLCRLCCCCRRATPPAKSDVETGETEGEGDLLLV